MGEMGPFWPAPAEPGDRVAGVDGDGDREGPEGLDDASDITQACSNPR